MVWKPLGGPQWRYCAKVGLAAALAYVLTRGADNEYAIYSASTSALIVGASVGEDLGTSGNRVKGTLAGMIAGLVVSAFLGPSAMAVGLSATATALVALAFGWGIPVARIGVTICIITLVFHAQNALEYDLLRAVNTVIGVVVGLAVSFFVWRVRASDTIEQAAEETLAETARLIDALAVGTPDRRPAMLGVYDAVSALVKAGRDAKLERALRLGAALPNPRAFQILHLALEVLAAALGAEGHAPQAASVEGLRRRLGELGVQR